MRASEIIPCTVAEARPPTITPDTVQQIIQKFEQGMTQREIAGELGISKSAVGNYLTRSPNWPELQQKNYKIRAEQGRTSGIPKGITPSDVQAMAKLYGQQGQTLDEIGDQFGISFVSVSQYLSKLPNWGELKQQNFQTRRAAGKQTNLTLNFSPDDFDQLSSQYAAGATIKGIANGFDVSEKSVMNYLKKLPDFEDLTIERNVNLLLKKKKQTRVAPRLFGIKSKS